MYHRANDSEMHAGGKAINVAIMLNRLGSNVMCFAYVGGPAGVLIRRDLEKENVTTKYIEIDGNNRVNIKLLNDDGNVTQIDAKGPRVSEDEIDRLFPLLDQIDEGDVVVLSGSLPEGVPTTIYRDIMRYLSYKNIKFIVDTTGEALTYALEEKPFLIKPNLDELEMVLQLPKGASKSLSVDDLIDCMRELHEQGAANVVVSLGADGAHYLGPNDNHIFLKPMQNQAVSPIGAGDSFIAGFISGYLETDDINFALKLATACGAATAGSLVLAHVEQIDYLMERN